MKTLLCTALILASACSYAGESTFEKSSVPRTIRLVNHGNAASYVHVKCSDLPVVPLSPPMKVENISWKTTHYPYNITEKIKICYFPYGDGVGKPSTCEEEVALNAPGVSDKFRSLRFGHQSAVQVIHSVSGDRQTISPAGNDRITIRFSY